MTIIITTIYFMTHLLHQISFFLFMIVTIKHEEDIITTINAHITSIDVVSIKTFSTGKSQMM